MFYAAYGSNLNMEQMAWRCPGARVVGTSVIKDYRLMFKGSKTGAYLTIEPAKGFEVPVGIWRVTDEDIKALNRYEGYPDFYYKKGFNLFCSDGHRHKSMAYIMHEDRLLNIPSEHYFCTCWEGYENFGFDKKYLFEALKYTRERRKAG